MPIVNTTIPNLIGGISQQPDRLKLDGQCNDSLNCYATVRDGLKKRPYVELVANIGSLSYDENSFVHFINRSVNERYVVLYSQTEGLKIFNLSTGAEATVNGDTTYLSTGSLNEDVGIKALTVADYTFLVNRSQTANLAADVSDALKTEAVIFISQGDFEKKYTATLDGVEFTFTSGANTSGANADTTIIASNLQSAIDGHPNFTAVQNGSVIRAWRTDTADFTATASDGLAGRGLKMIYKQVEDLTDLPTQCYNLHKVEVAGDSESDVDNYWVEFQLGNGSTTEGEYGEGTWVETIAPATKTKFDETTMPYTLVNTGVDTFDFEPFTWDERLVGDDDTNPAPSFVGTNINDVFFFKNRLGFISDENVILSESGNFSNFWRGTVTQLLDSTTIDVAVSHTRPAILRHAIATSARLILFSDRNQFSLKGEDLLTNETISITPVTSFENDLNVNPTTVGRYTYFAFQRGQHSGIREYYLDNLVNEFDQNEITGHVSTLIPQNLKHITGTTSEDHIAILPRDSSEFYLYSFFWNGREKAMSSWSRQSIYSDRIIGMEFVDSDLYMVTSVGGYLHIQFAPFEQGLSDGAILQTGSSSGETTLFIGGLTSSPEFNGVYYDNGNTYNGSAQYEQANGGVIRRTSVDDLYWQIVDSNNSDQVIATSFTEAADPWEITFWTEL